MLAISRLCSFHAMRNIEKVKMSGKRVMKDMVCPPYMILGIHDSSSSVTGAYTCWDAVQGALGVVMGVLCRGAYDMFSVRRMWVGSALMLEYPLGVGRDMQGPCGYCKVDGLAARRAAVSSCGMGDAAAALMISRECLISWPIQSGLGARGQTAC